MADNFVPDTQRSLSDKMDIQSLSVPLQNKRWGSLTNLAVPDHGVRRRSFSGPFSGQTDTEFSQRRQSADQRSSKDRFGFNPLIQKLSNKTVVEIIIGMVLTLIVVLVVSLFRLIT